MPTKFKKLSKLKCNCLIYYVYRRQPLSRSIRAPSYILERAIFIKQNQILSKCIILFVFEHKPHVRRTLILNGSVKSCVILCLKFKNTLR